MKKTLALIMSFILAFSLSISVCAASDGSVRDVYANGYHFTISETTGENGSAFTFNLPDDISELIQQSFTRTTRRTMSIQGIFATTRPQSGSAQ